MSAIAPARTHRLLTGVSVGVSVAPLTLCLFYPLKEQNRVCPW